MYRISHTKTEYTFFSSVNGTFLRVDHVLDQKTILGKPKETEIISSIFSDYNAMTLEIKFKEEKNLPKKKMWRHTQMWRLNKMLLNNQ